MANNSGLMVRSVDITDMGTLTKKKKKRINSNVMTSSHLTPASTHNSTLQSGTTPLKICAPSLGAKTSTTVAGKIAAKITCTLVVWSAGALGTAAWHRCKVQRRP
jgi:hypothetical protein